MYSRSSSTSSSNLPGQLEMSKVPGQLEMSKVPGHLEMSIVPEGRSAKTIRNKDFDGRTAPRRRRSRKFFANVFAKVRRKNSISHIFRTFRRVREVESYAPSKFQPPTTLGDHQNVEKTIRENIDFLGSRKSVFPHVFCILEELGNFRRQNQFPRQNLLQIHLF